RDVPPPPRIPLSAGCPSAGCPRARGARAPAPLAALPAAGRRRSVLGVRRLVALGAGEQRLAQDAGALAHAALDGVGDLGIVLEELPGILAPLPEPLAVVGEPGARLLDDAALDPEVEQLAGLGDALAVHDVELDLAERRGELVLDHL